MTQAAVRSFTVLCPPDDLTPLRRHAAMARSLLDELDRAIPESGVIPHTETAIAVREQLAEELGRMGCRLLECAASLTETLNQRSVAGQA